MNNGNLPRVALIAGPTASGKSALALALAERHHGTIINADSAQVYKDLRVLTARPDQREEARVPHRLFGYIDGAEPYSAARWAGDAMRVIDDVITEGRHPILVGGSGLYQRTLLEGIAPVPAVDPAIRTAVRSLSVKEAYIALSNEDPVAAGKLSPNDTSRVARALEVIRSSGRPLSEWQSERGGGIGNRIDLRVILLLPDSAVLGARIRDRAQRMLQSGAIEEVEALRARNDLAADAPVLRAIGVNIVGGLIDETLDHDEAQEKLVTATRRYAKRQVTWYRHQPLQSNYTLMTTEIDDIKLLLNRVDEFFYNV